MCKISIERSQGNMVSSTTHTHTEERERERVSECVCVYVKGKRYLRVPLDLIPFKLCSTDLSKWIFGFISFQIGLICAVFEICFRRTTQSDRRLLTRVFHIKGIVQTHNFTALLWDLNNQPLIQYN